jgi:hypothetical protein
VVIGRRVVYSENAAERADSKVSMFRLAGTAAQQAAQSGHAEASRWAGLSVPGRAVIKLCPSAIRYSYSVKSHENTTGMELGGGREMLALGYEYPHDSQTCSIPTFADVRPVRQATNCIQ